jgi:hypothetical protein
MAQNCSVVSPQLNIPNPYPTQTPSSQLSYEPEYTHSEIHIQTLDQHRHK